MFLVSLNPFCLYFSRKLLEGNFIKTYYKAAIAICFNDALNTFYLRLGLYGIGHMVKDHSDSEKKPSAATWASPFN